ncbi:MAG: alpha/beta fold hydrolase [Capsulimonadales bacterium]|nr:alpha/beta fold hydrolase [Capsulimonadales bacterium]
MALPGAAGCACLHHGRFLTRRHERRAATEARGERMLAATYRVTIERHEVGEIPALVYRSVEEERSDPPFVFVIHGLASRKERHLDLCLRLTDAGFRACAFDVAGHGERRADDTDLLFGPRSAPGFAGAFLRTVVASVAELRQLADYFELTRGAVVGHSMGGYIALQAALNDPRIEAVVNIAGSIDTARFPVAEEASAEVRELSARADVVARAAEFAPRPVLLIHGEQDETVPFTGAERLYAALRDAYGDASGRVSLKRYPGLTHRDFPPAMARAATDWLATDWQATKVVVG